MTDLEQRILAFAIANRPLFDAVAEFGWKPATYLLRLYAVIDDPRVEREDPLTVRRLRRLRDQRTAARAARLFG